MNDLAPMAFGLLKNAPPEAQNVFMLLVWGLNNAEVARRLGISESTVRYHIKTHDPDGVVKYTNQTRKFVLGSMLDRLAFEALCTVTPEQLKGMSPKDKMAFAREAMRARQSLGSVDLPESPNEDRLHDQLKGGGDGEGA